MLMTCDLNLVVRELSERRQVVQGLIREDLAVGGVFELVSFGG